MSSLWGGFDLGNSLGELSKLGNSLGEVIQKANATLDNAFKDDAASTLPADTQQQEGHGPVSQSTARGASPAQHQDQGPAGPAQSAPEPAVAHASAAARLTSGEPAVVRKPGAWRAPNNAATAALHDAHQPAERASEPSAGSGATESSKTDGVAGQPCQGKQSEPEASVPAQQEAFEAQQSTTQLGTAAIHEPATSSASSRQRLSSKPYSSRPAIDVRDAAAASGIPHSQGQQAAQAEASTSSTEHVSAPPAARPSPHRKQSSKLGAVRQKAGSPEQPPSSSAADAHDTGASMPIAADGRTEQSHGEAEIAPGSVDAASQLPAAETSSSSAQNGSLLDAMPELPDNDAWQNDDAITSHMFHGKTSTEATQQEVSPLSTSATAIPNGSAALKSQQHSPRTRKHSKNTAPARPQQLTSAQQPSSVVQRPVVAHADDADGATSAAPVPAATTASGAGADGAAIGADAAAISLPTDAAELAALAMQLQAELAAREMQMVRQAARLGEMEEAAAKLVEDKVKLSEVVEQLQAANEQLALRSAKVSESDFESLRSEFEARLAAAERKAYALSKERDALRRTVEAGSSTAAQLNDKEETIKQVMEEGAKLSKRQLELEGTIKRLRQQLKDSEAERTKLAAALAAESEVSEGLRKAKAKAERDLAEGLEAARAEVEAAREAGETAALRAQAEQLAAEERAREAVSEDLGRRLAESQARCAALADSVGELREALDAQRQAADSREEMYKQELADVERRLHSAEARHNDLAVKLPEATQPLIREMESMRASAAAQADAWAAAERALKERAADAEARAESAAARAEMAEARAESATARLSEAMAAAQQLQRAAAAAEGQREAGAERLRVQQEMLEAVQQEGAVLAQQVAALREELQQAHATARQQLATERKARAADLAAARLELERATSSSAAGTSSQLMQRQDAAGGPPAMAAPGFRWVLVKEGDAAPSTLQQQQQQQQHQPPDLDPGHLEDMPASPASTTSAVDATVFDLLRAGSEAGSSHQLATQGSHTHSTGGADGSYAAGRRASRSEAQVERLRAAVRAKTGEVAALESHVRELQASCDSLAEELLRATHRIEATASAAAEVERLRASQEDLSARYAAAIELVGERDEQLEELKADLMDVKHLYKDQIEYLVGQLAAAGRLDAAAAAIPSSNGV